LNFTATLSGELILLRAIVTGVLTMAIVRLVGSGRVDSRILLAAGFALVAASNIWLASVSTSTTPFWSLAEPLMLAGAGLALVFIPLSIAVLSSVPGEVAPKATAFVNLFLQLGGSISTAALVTLLSHREAFHQTILAAGVSLHSSLVRDVVAHHQLSLLYHALVQQANTMAFADASYLVGFAGFFCIPLVFLLERRKRA